MYVLPVVISACMYVYYAQNKVYLLTYLLTHLDTYLSTYLPTYLPACLPACLPTYLLTYLFTYLLIGITLPSNVAITPKSNWCRLFVFMLHLYVLLFMFRPIVLLGSC